jgi:hydroxypyruvate isomerase
MITIFFRKELMNRANAIKLAGFEAVKYALEYDEYNF